MKKLKEQLGYCVHTATREQYNQLMVIYEEVGWRWVDGVLPCNGGHWGKYKEITCVTLKNNCHFGREQYYLDEGIKVLTFPDFLLRIEKTFLMWGEYNEPLEKVLDIDI